VLVAEILAFMGRSATMSSSGSASSTTWPRLAQSLAGVGRVADGATVAYRGAEAQARRKGNGLWARP
jgi:hypothetical protein